MKDPVSGVEIQEWTLGAKWLHFREEVLPNTEFLEPDHPLRNVGVFMAGAAAAYNLIASGVSLDLILAELGAFANELKSVVPDKAAH
jgi:hypothetical protein